MNNEENVLARLLKLYPVKVLSQVFDSKERLQEKIIKEVIDTYTVDSIKEFSYENFEITKQTVYVYDIRNKYVHRENINGKEIDVTILAQTISNGTFLMHGYHEVTYDIKMYKNLVEEISVVLFQPFKVKIVGNHLIISVTKLEPNPKSFFDDNVTIINASKENFDSILIDNILSYFDGKFNIRPSQCDLNKGIKALWDSDIIDAKELSFRKTSSRAKEIMDGEELFKDKYPEEYKEVMKKPLELCTFRYLEDDLEWPKHFVCDPRIGKISFNIYSENDQQTNNVLDGIIGNN
ncbi:hypothetical protein BCY89_28015 [Sphingobacterium siyangense]|uniref:Uncharacterized protein n=1 Tax=Sphingobacterium siyangense TaxID=459529 RepID=A0A420FSX1_9SPHI|nr:hypothetical protein [Sphingobacterium siyangense]RKF36067.1 hypothetical protein BCY89_28015 [Sphingobacterium siyangense]